MSFRAEMQQSRTEGDNIKENLYCDKETRMKGRTLLSVLGEDCFYDLLLFFADIMQSDEQVKILMTRRLYDLYCVFEGVIEYLYKGGICLKGQIVTNLSAVLFLQNNYSQNADLKVLIVDDIILHGRTLRKEYKYLKRYGCRGENIRAKVFLNNNVRKRIECNLLKNLDSWRDVGDSQWRILSGSLINAFVAAGQPYVSYLPFIEYDFGTDAAEKLQKFLDEGRETGDILEITSEVQKSFAIESFLYYIAEESKLNFKISQCNMIRIKKYHDRKKFQIVPYVYLKPIEKTRLKNFYIDILKEKKFMQFEEKLKPSPDNFRADVEEPCYRYMYSSLSYMCSMALGNLFLNECGIRQWQWEENPIALGFCCAGHMQGKEKEFLGLLEPEDSEKIMFVGDEEIRCDLPTEIENILSEEKSERQTMSLDSFIRFCGKTDEELAAKQQDRIKGVPASTLFRRFGAKDLKKFWAKMISLADAGKSTISVCMNRIGEEYYIGSLVTEGEQNFTCNEEAKIALVMPLMELKYFCKRQGLDWEKRKKSLLERVYLYCPEIQRVLSSDEKKEAETTEVMEFEDYYFNRYPIYEENSVVAKALKVEVQYEREM